MQKDRRPSFIISGILRGQNQMMYSLETLWDSMWNNPWNWNYHGTGRFLVFIRICPRGITTKKGFVLHENSMGYFMWNLTESLWKNSYVLPT